MNRNLGTRPAANQKVLIPKSWGRASRGRVGRRLESHSYPLPQGCGTSEVRHRPGRTGTKTRPTRPPEPPKQIQSPANSPTRSLAPTPWSWSPFARQDYSQTDPVAHPFVGQLVFGGLLCQSIVPMLRVSWLHQDCCFGQEQHKLRTQIASATYSIDCYGFETDNVVESYNGQRNC